MTNIAIIPARAGSKRIPNKNIKLFNGKPIIEWPITAALHSNIFEKIFVSTDCLHIAEVATASGAEVPFVRPKELSDDFTGVFPVVQHAIRQIEEQYTDFENVCCIYPTAALISKQNLADSLSYFLDLKCNFLMGVCEYTHPIERALSLTIQGALKLKHSENSNLRTQDISPSYYDAGQFYWGNKHSWKSFENMFQAQISPYILPFHNAVDIDNPPQWAFAEKMFRTLYA